LDYDLKREDFDETAVVLIYCAAMGDEGGQCESAGAGYPRGPGARCENGG